MPRKLSPNKRTANYSSRTFYYPVRDEYKLIWNFFEEVLLYCKDPKTDYFDSRILRESLIRKLIFHFLNGQLYKVSKTRELTEAEELAYEVLCKILNEEGEEPKELFRHSENV